MTNSTIAGSERRFSHSGSRQHRERFALAIEHRHVGAAEAVNRLFFVAHHEKFRRARGAFGQKTHHAVLDRVGVLVFVDQQSAERAPVALGELWMVLEETPGQDQQIVEGDDALLALAPLSSAATSAASAEISSVAGAAR